MNKINNKTLYIIGGSVVGVVVLYLVFKPKTTTPPVTPLTPTQIAALKVQQQQATTATGGIGGMVTSVADAFKSIFGKTPPATTTPAALGAWVNGVRTNADGSTDYDNGDGTFTEYDAKSANATIYNNDGTIFA